MPTKLKREQKHSYIEAKDQNETKTFDVFQNLKWNVSNKTKTFWRFPSFFSRSKTFIFIPKILEQNQNFLMCSNFFLAKSKRYYLIQKLTNRTKTFGFISQISKIKTELFVVSRKIWKLNKPNTFGPKILRSERERFVPIMNFVSKTNIFDFFGGRLWENESKRTWKNVGLTSLATTPCTGDRRVEELSG